MKNIIIVGTCLFTFIAASAAAWNFAARTTSAPVIATVKVTPKTVDTVSVNDIRTRWIKLLNQHNPELHDAVLACMLASKVSGKEVFILTENNEARTAAEEYIFRDGLKYKLSYERGGVEQYLFRGKLRYKLSYERGGVESIMSYSHKENWFSFDHYNEKMGPTMAMAESMIVIDQRIGKYYTELGIK